MTEVEALLLSYGFTVACAFFLMQRWAMSVVSEYVIPAWRSGIVPNMPPELVDNPRVLLGLRLSVAACCALLATTWFTCLFVWLALKVAIGAMGRGAEEVFAQAYDGLEGKDTKLGLAYFRELGLDECPNCGADLHAPALTLHEPAGPGVCISQWDDIELSHDLLKRMTSAETGAVDAKGETPP